MTKSFLYKLAAITAALLTVVAVSAASGQNPQLVERIDELEERVTVLESFHESTTVITEASMNVREADCGVWPEVGFNVSVTGPDELNVTVLSPNGGLVHEVTVSEDFPVESFFGTGTEWHDGTYSLLVDGDTVATVHVRAPAPCLNRKHVQKG